MSKAPNYLLLEKKSTLEKFLDNASHKIQNVPFAEASEKTIMQMFNCSSTAVKNIKGSYGLKINSISENKIRALQKFYKTRLFNDYQDDEKEFFAIVRGIRENPLSNSLKDPYTEIAKKAFSLVPISVINNAWLVFERHEREAEEFGQKVLKFSNSKYGTQAILTSNLQNQEEWVGIANYIVGDQLVTVSLFNKQTCNRYIHILFNLESVTNFPEICIGHQALKNVDNMNVISKLIVLYRSTNLDSPLPSKFSISSSQVPEAIRDLLLDRDKSRLSSPHKTTVYDLPTLREWHNQNNSYHGKLYESIAGNYKIFYRTKAEETEIIRDELKLERLSVSELSAEYRHFVPDSVANLWIGTGFINRATYTINLYLKGPFRDRFEYYSRRGADDQPIFLIIDLPKDQVVEIDCLVGIASGQRDKIKGNVSRLIVLKKNNSKSEGIEEAILDDFFRLFADRLRVRPPSEERIFNLKTLKDEIDVRAKEEAEIKYKNEKKRQEDLDQLREQCRQELMKEFSIGETKKTESAE